MRPPSCSGILVSIETAFVPITGRLAPPWHWILPHFASLRTADTIKKTLSEKKQRFDTKACQSEGTTKNCRKRWKTASVCRFLKQLHQLTNGLITEFTQRGTSSEWLAYKNRWRPSRLLISCYLSQITFFPHISFCVKMLRHSFHTLMRIANEATWVICCMSATNLATPLLRPGSCDVLPGVAFGKGAFAIFPTVPVWISCRVDAFKAYSRSRFRTYNQREREREKQNIVFLYLKGDRGVADSPAPHRVMHCCSWVWQMPL